METKNSKNFLLITLFNVLITVAEFIGGIISGSLALLSDAVHNLSDVASIILAYIANLISQKQKNDSKTFGYKRAEIIAAFINGILLIAISIYLLIEAIGRFSNPQPIQGKIMFIVSLIGLAGNVISMLVLLSSSKNSLNAKALFLNMSSDALSSVAVVIGSIVIYIWNITIIDPILTILASIFLFGEAIKVTKKAVDILMESNPNIDLNKINSIILSFPEVKQVHHIHIWQYSDDMIMLDAHINVDKDLTVGQLEKTYDQIGKKLKDNLNINHVTLQAECKRGKNEELLSK